MKTILRSTSGKPKLADKPWTDNWWLMRKNNIMTARVEPQNRRRSYRAQQRAAAKRRNVAKSGGGR